MHNSETYPVHHTCAQRGQSALHLVSSSYIGSTMKIVAWCSSMEQVCLPRTKYEPCYIAAYSHDTMGVLQAGETALQTLAERYTRGDESQLIEVIENARLTIAVKSGDIADIRRLGECQGVDIHTRDRVRSTTF